MLTPDKPDPSIRRYHYFDTVIDSDVALPDLFEATAGVEPLVQIRFRPGVCRLKVLTWFRQWVDAQGTLVAAAGITPRDYVLRFGGVGDLALSRDCSQIGYGEFVAADLPQLRRRLLDQVLPRAFAQRGTLVLHASAVHRDDRALCLLGKSGHGKSTLAAYLAGSGFVHFGDDALLLHDGPGSPRCVANYAGVRLWPDSAAALRNLQGYGASADCEDVKRRLRPVSTPAAAHHLGHPIAAVVVLDPPPGRGVGPTWTRASGADVAAALFAQCFKFDISDQSHIANLFVKACRLAAAVPVYRLNYSRDFGMLASVRRAIVELLDDAGTVTS